MIRPEDITTLHSAEELRKNSKTAFDDHNRMSVATAINNASNCGETEVLYTGYISPKIIKEIEDKKCTVVKNPNSASEHQYIISWK